MILEQLLDTMSDSELIVLYKNGDPFLTDEKENIPEKYYECDVTEMWPSYIQYGAFNRPAICIEIEVEED